MRPDILREVLQNYTQILQHRRSMLKRSLVDVRDVEPKSTRDIKSHEPISRSSWRVGNRADMPAK